MADNLINFPDEIRMYRDGVLIYGGAVHAKQLYHDDSMPGQRTVTVFGYPMGDGPLHSNSWTFDADNPLGGCEDRPAGMEMTFGLIVRTLEDHGSRLAALEQESESCEKDRATIFAGLTDDAGRVDALEGDQPTEAGGRRIRRWGPATLEADTSIPEPEPPADEPLPPMPPGSEVFVKFCGMWCFRTPGGMYLGLAGIPPGDPWRRRAADDAIEQWYFAGFRAEVGFGDALLALNEWRAWRDKD